MEYSDVSVLAPGTAEQLKLMVSPYIFVYVINVDWYFDLHWLERAKANLNADSEVHIVMGQTNPAITDKLIQLGFICHAWNIERKSMNLFQNVARLLDLYSLLKSIKPDIVHAITIKPNISVGLIAHVLKIPYVLSITGTGVIFSGSSFAVRLARPIVRGLYKLANSKIRRKLIFENFTDRDYFVHTGLCRDYEAVAILGSGVNTEEFIQVPEIQRPKPVLLFAARLLWDKGLGDLIEAGKLLRKRGIDFSIQVAGIVDQDTINAIAQETLDKWHADGLIECLGTVKNMPDLIAEANIVVLPTFYGEGVPRILIEAASCGRAIVTTDMPGCREIVKDQINGLLVPPKNVEKLTNALTKLLESPELRTKMGQQGRHKVKRDFSEQKVITETMALYQELLE